MKTSNQNECATRIVESFGGNLFPGDRTFWERVDGDLRPRTIEEIEGRIRAWLYEHGVSPESIRLRMLFAVVRSTLPKLDDRAEDVRHAKMLGRAKQYAEERCSPDYKRKWLLAGTADSYQNAGNRAEFWVLEGSPSKAFIIHVHGLHGWTGVYGIGGKQLKLIRRDDV